jgi:hypothetical protein
MQSKANFTIFRREFWGSWGLQNLNAIQHGRHDRHIVASSPHDSPVFSRRIVRGTCNRGKMWLVCSMLALILPGNSARDRSLTAPVHPIPVGQATSRTNGASTGLLEAVHLVSGESASALHRTMFGRPTKNCSGLPEGVRARLTALA